MSRAAYWVGAGDRERVFRYLDLAISGGPLEAWACENPELERLRHDPRFSQYQSKVVAATR